MMKVALRVGKLAEVRFRPPLADDQLSGFMAGVRGLVQAASEPLVFCTDWRGIDAFAPDIADTIIWIMRRDNPNIRANAVLVSATRAAFLKQVEAILSEAHNRSRRVFAAPAGLYGFVDPLLDAAERTQLRAFLAETD